MCIKMHNNEYLLKSNTKIIFAFDFFILYNISDEKRFGKSFAL